MRLVKNKQTKNTGVRKHRSHPERVANSHILENLRKNILIDYNKMNKRNIYEPILSMKKERKERKREKGEREGGKKEQSSGQISIIKCRRNIKKNRNAHLEHYVITAAIRTHAKTKSVKVDGEKIYLHSPNITLTLIFINYTGKTETVQ